MEECPTGLLLSVYMITFILGFPANVLAFYTFCKKVREKPAPMDVLLLNLTISDLLFLVTLPFRMHEAINNCTLELPDVLCLMSGFIFYLTIYNSIFCLTAISVERYLGVAFPVKHRLKHRPLYAVGVTIFIWILILLHISIGLVMTFFRNRKSPEILNQNTSTVVVSRKTVVCHTNFTEDQLTFVIPFCLELCIVLFCIPLLICTFCYINFIRILSRLQHINRRRRLRAIGMAFGTLLIFTICFGPYNVSHIVGYIQWKTPELSRWFLLCSTFNACLDPIIFYFSSSAMRGNVAGIMDQIKRRLCGCTSSR